MIVNFIWWWGSSSRALMIMKYFFIAITHKFTQTWSGSTLVIKLGILFDCFSSKLFPSKI